MDYACVAGARGGVARCRSYVARENWCAQHNEGSPKAPQPSVVLVKINLDNRWDSVFERAGIPKVARSPERAQQLAQEHQVRAERLGRDPFVIREAREGERPSEPEAADSGCPVFGKAGLQSVDIRGLVTELKAAGFHLTGVHRLAREWKPPVRLVLQFTREGQDLSQFPWDLFRGLTATCFNQADVWANDRDGRGQVVHTVNCGKREDGARPEYVLRYADGDWEAHYQGPAK